MKTKIFNVKTISAAAFILTVVVNILANVLPIGGMNTGQISAMYPTLFTPPGITFGIWGVIYAMLAIFMIIEFIRDYRRSSTRKASSGASDSASLTDTDSTSVLEDIGPYFILSSMFNIAWILAWHSQLIVPATIAIIGLFLTLIVIYSMTRKQDFIAKTTFSIYYAWITVATIAALFIFVKTVSGGAPVTPIEPRMGFVPGELLIIGGDPEIVSYVSNVEYVFATFAALLAGAVTIFHIIKFRDFAYVLTMLWAIIGILIRQTFAFTPPVLMIIAAAVSVFAISFVSIKTILNDSVTIKRGKESHYENLQMQ